MEFLGHLVSADGVSPRPGLVKAVVECPCPKNKDELCSFLGLCEFYSRFIPDYASKMKVLSNMLRTNVPFVWDSNCQETFELVKSEMVSTKTLRDMIQRFPVQSLLTLAIMA